MRRQKPTKAVIHAGFELQVLLSLIIITSRRKWQYSRTVHVNEHVHITDTIHMDIVIESTHKQFIFF
jgi:hypothetical protein